MSSDAVTRLAARMSQSRRFFWGGTVVLLGSLLAACVYVVSNPVFELAFQIALDSNTIKIHAPARVDDTDSQTPSETVAPSSGEQTEETVQVLYPDIEPMFSTVHREDRLNILLFGFDTRKLDPSAPLTDTLMLLSWHQDENTLDILSIPRDLWVPVPGFPPTKINLVYSLGESVPSTGGGEQLLMDTLSAFLNQPIEHFAWVNFDGFVRLIDLIGGINVYVPWDIYDDKYPTPDYGIELFELSAGHQYLDGATTLKYARTRTQDGDYGRIGRQQAVIGAILNQVSSPANAATLLAAMPSIVQTLRGNFGTDMNVARILHLAQKAATSTPEAGRRLILDRQHGQEAFSAEGMWVLIPDRDAIRSATTDFFGVEVQQTNLTPTGETTGS